eukprot:GHVR01148854.1.p1 GENE.GHVR01148854.1~~GHVR01148854.1.p1  ORF type:complete len:260 (+),score=44.91 GHVR01148854.1:389-1168(+)
MHLCIYEPLIRSGCLKYFEYVNPMRLLSFCWGGLSSFFRHRRGYISKSDVESGDMMTDDTADDDPKGGHTVGHTPPTDILSICVCNLSEVVSYPILTLATRFAVLDTPTHSIKELLSLTLTHDGLSGFYRGLFPLMVHNFLTQMSHWAVNTLASKFELEEMDRFLMRVCVDACVSLISGPLVAVSTLMRTQSNIDGLCKLPSVVTLLRHQPHLSTLGQSALVFIVLVCNLKLIQMTRDCEDDVSEITDTPKGFPQTIKQ